MKKKKKTIQMMCGARPAVRKMAPMTVLKGKFCTFWFSLLATDFGEMCTGGLICGFGGFIQIQIWRVNLNLGRYAAAAVLKSTKTLEVCIFENLRTKPNSNLNIFKPNRTVREEVRE
jgi:hypothetical protein